MTVAWIAVHIWARKSDLGHISMQSECSLRGFWSSGKQKLCMREENDGDHWQSINNLGSVAQFRLIK